MYYGFRSDKARIRAVLAELGFPTGLWLFSYTAEAHTFYIRPRSARGATKNELFILQQIGGLTECRHYISVPGSGFLLTEQVPYSRWAT